MAFSDANALWAPDALRELVLSFADPGVGYACGQVAFLNEGGTNQEGMYWRYEMWLRALSRGWPRSPVATARSTRRAETTTSSSIR